MLDSDPLATVPVWVTGNVTCCVNVLSAIGLEVNVGLNAVGLLVNEVSSELDGGFDSCSDDQYVSWHLAVL